MYKRQIDSGTRLRLSGHGESPRHQNGSPGNLYIEIMVEDHEWFERDGSDLLMALPVSYLDLLLGANIEFPHIDGSPLKVNIKPGSKPGETITILNRGLPFPRGKRGRGAVMVLLKLSMPEKVSRTTKKRLQDLREELGSKKSITENIIEEARNRRRS